MSFYSPQQPPSSWQLPQSGIQPVMQVPSSSGVPNHTLSMIAMVHQMQQSITQSLSAQLPSQQQQQMHFPIAPVPLSHGVSASQGFDEELLSQTLHEQTSKGNTYRVALESLHGRNGIAAFAWKDYYLEHKLHIDSMVDKLRIRSSPDLLECGQAPDTNPKSTQGRTPNPTQGCTLEVDLNLMQDRIPEVDPESTQSRIPEFNSVSTCGRTFDVDPDPTQGRTSKAYPKPAQGRIPEADPTSAYGRTLDVNPEPTQGRVPEVDPRPMYERTIVADPKQAQTLRPGTDLNHVQVPGPEEEPSSSEQEPNPEELPMSGQDCNLGEPGFEQEPNLGQELDLEVKPGIELDPSTRARHKRPIQRRRQSGIKFRRRRTNPKPPGENGKVVNLDDPAKSQPIRTKEIDSPATGTTRRSKRIEKQKTEILQRPVRSSRRALNGLYSASASFLATVPSCIPIDDHTGLPAAPSRPPTPPRSSSEVNARGVAKYTDDDAIFFFKRVAYDLSRNLSLSKQDLCDILAKEAPHHTSCSWNRYWSQHENVADKMMLLTQVNEDDREEAIKSWKPKTPKLRSSSPAKMVKVEETQTLLPEIAYIEPSPESSLSEISQESDEEDIGSTDEDEEFGTVETPLTVGEIRALAKHIASRPYWKGEAKDWFSFCSIYDHRPLSSWQGYYPRWSKVIGKLVEKYKERELVRQQQYHTITSQRGKPSWVSSTNKHESSFRGAFDSIHYRLKRKFSDIDSQGNVRRRYTGASNSVRSSGISSSTAFTLDK